MVPLTVRVPLILRDVKVPTDVIFGWAAVARVPYIPVPTYRDLVTLTPPAICTAPVIKLVASVVDVSKVDPLTVKEDNVPTEVILGWVAVASVPVMLPPTVKEDNVPTDVMFG